MRAACTRRRCWARRARWQPATRCAGWNWSASTHLHASLALLFGLLAVVAFSLILFDRSDRVYLWMGALFLLIAALSALEVIGAWTELQGLSVNNLLIDGLVLPLVYAAWVMVFWVWFGLQAPAVAAAAHRRAHTAVNGLKHSG